MTDHEWTHSRWKSGYKIFDCNDKEKSVKASNSASLDFDYCPFCGDEL